MQLKLSFICKYASKKDLHIPVHSHNCHEFVFFGSGCNGTVTVEGQKFKFCSGDLLFTPANHLHCEKHNSSGKIIYFGFFNYEPTNLRTGLYSTIYNAKTIIEQILHESIEQPLNYEELISLKLRELLIHTERSFQNDTVTKNLIYSQNYINENYMQPISIYDIAKMTRYSYDHFRHLFKQRFGVSPKTYLMNVRCKNAIDLLQNSEQSCTNIAYMCGFSDSGQMSKIFKSRFGRLPLSFRYNNNKSGDL